MSADALSDATRAWFEREAKLYDVLRDMTDVIRQLNTEMGELRDELVTHETRHRRDIAALRESIRATDSVLNSRTAHLA